MQNSYMYCVFCNSESSKVQNSLYLLCFLQSGELACCCVSLLSVFVSRTSDGDGGRPAIAQLTVPFSRAALSTPSLQKETPSQRVRCAIARGRREPQHSHDQLAKWRPEELAHAFGAKGCPESLVALIAPQRKD